MRSSSHTQEPYNSCTVLFSAVKSNRLPTIYGSYSMWQLYVQVALPSHRKPVKLHKSLPRNDLNTPPHICRDSYVCSHPLTIVISVSMCCLFFFTEEQMSSGWSGCPVCFNLGGKTMGWLLWQCATNCCYLVLEGYMLLLFLYVVAYFADLGTVGNNDCCCRSNDVGNFFFLFHIYLLALSQSRPLPPTPLFCLFLLQSAL